MLFLNYYCLFASLIAQLVKNLPAVQETGFNPWVEKIPWRRKWQPPPVTLPGKSHGQRSLVGCSPRCRKESGTSEQLTLTFTYFILNWILLTALLLLFRGSYFKLCFFFPLWIFSLSNPLFKLSSQLEEFSHFN